ncbi:MAG: hypothetical protein DRI74_09640 [Bacteroidetes bacterium]|nr:MAG: hypothetical protein DRI74_09640 [Bacteroidota bacterium]
MPRFLYLFFSLILYLLSPYISAQNIIDDKQVYGLNPLLYNGKVYSYFPGDQVKGHQYFKQKAFSEGCVSIRGTKYENILLNYDILNQEVILKYSDPQGSNRLLAVSKAWLEKFSISNEQFSLINTPDGHKLIVQTLNQGKIQLHNHWTTRIIAEISFVAEHYTFEKKRNTLFISYENKLKKFNSTKDILNLFNDENKLKIKRYLKQNKLKTRRNSLNQLIGLINYCNQL